MFVLIASDSAAEGDDFIRKARRMRDALAELYAAAAACAHLGDEQGPMLLTGDDLPVPHGAQPSSGWSPAPLPDDYRITRFPIGDTSHPSERREVVDGSVRAGVAEIASTVGACLRALDAGSVDRATALRSMAFQLEADACWGRTAAELIFVLHQLANW
ncbi:Hypothetical protein A7982_05921 [Minicystis rosea]|nr:Hypothetical protein A7982_05921 [Minicystis rosea]